MSTFIVKTHDNRNLVLKADKFSFNADYGSYSFFNKDEVVASLPGREVFAVLSSEVEVADFYHNEHCEAHELLERAVDLLLGEDRAEEEDPTFAERRAAAKKILYEDYFEYAGDVLCCQAPTDVPEVEGE